MAGAEYKDISVADSDAPQAQDGINMPSLPAGECLYESDKVNNIIKYIAGFFMVLCGFGIFLIWGLVNDKDDTYEDTYITASFCSLLMALVCWGKLARNTHPFVTAFVSMMMFNNFQVLACTAHGYAGNKAGPKFSAKKDGGVAAGIAMILASNLVLFPLHIKFPGKDQLKASLTDVGQVAAFLPAILLVVGSFVGWSSDLVCAMAPTAFYSFVMAAIIVLSVLLNSPHLKDAAFFLAVQMIAQMPPTADGIDKKAKASRALTYTAVLLYCAVFMYGSQLKWRRYREMRLQKTGTVMDRVKTTSFMGLAALCVLAFAAAIMVWARSKKDLVPGASLYVDLPMVNHTAAIAMISVFFSLAGYLLQSTTLEGFTVALALGLVGPLTLGIQVYGKAPRMGFMLLSFATYAAALLPMIHAAPNRPTLKRDPWLGSGCFGLMCSLTLWSANKSFAVILMLMACTQILTSVVEHVPAMKFTVMQAILIAPVVFSQYSATNPFALVAFFGIIVTYVVSRSAEISVSDPPEITENELEAPLV